MAIKCCRNLILDDLLNIVPISDRCPLIIQTVADIADAVDGTVVGQLTVERYVDDQLNEHIHLYTWDGSDWQLTIDSSSIFVVEDGGYKAVLFENTYGNWDFSPNEGVSWHTGTFIFTAPYPTVVNLWFRNLDNNCVYSNLPEIPLAIYCVESYLVDASTDPFFFFGTINGIQADDTANVLATYANWQGNTTAIPSITVGVNLAVVIIRDSATAAFTNMGTYVPFGGGDPVIWAPSIVNCTRNCYQAVFTVNDIDLDGLSLVQSSIGSLIDTDEIPFSDPTWASQYLALMISSSFIEPTATITTSNNGNEVTITICSVIPISDGLWSNDDGSISGTFTFTQI